MNMDLNFDKGGVLSRPRKCKFADGYKRNLTSNRSVGFQ